MLEYTSFKDSIYAMIRYNHQIESHNKKNDLQKKRPLEKRLVNAFIIYAIVTTKDWMFN